MSPGLVYPVVPARPRLGNRGLGSRDPLACAGAKRERTDMADLRVEMPSLSDYIELTDAGDPSAT